MSETPIVFCPVSRTNLDELADGLSDLHQAVWAERFGRDQWHWRYLDNPAGGTSTVVALRQGRVIGKLGSVHQRLDVAGAAEQPVLAGLTEDLSVLPEARSWRCNQGLVSASYAHPASARLAFSYAFVISKVAELNRRTGGMILGRLPVWAGFLSVTRMLRGRGVGFPLSLAGHLAQPLIGLRRRAVPPNDLEVRPIDRFGADCGRLWDDLRGRHAVSVIRDAAYMNWRYVDRPGRQYERLGAYRSGRLEGLAVFSSKPARRTAFLLELLARDDQPAILARLLHRTAEQLAEMGSGLISASFPARSAEAAALGRTGFRPWAGRLWGIHLLISRDPAAGPGPELDIANWYFSLGDWLTH